MAEYMLLATFVTVLAVSTVWTVRTLKYIGKACYQAILPSAKSNIRKEAKPEKVELRTLSESLAEIRMPWGWQPVRLAPVHNGTAAIPAPHPASIVAPWGWPGNQRHPKVHSRNGHAKQRHNGTNGALNGHGETQPEPSDFDGAALVRPLEDDGLAMDIRGSQFGGYYVVDDGHVPVSEARSPWGW